MSRRLLGRRQLLVGAGALVGSAVLAKAAWPSDGIVREPSFQAYPFSLGVASGDPLPDGFVLWTRLAPDPLAGGGMPPVPVAVRWEVADDERMRRIVRSGTAIARPDLAHSVHVEVTGLEPDRWYSYRFTAGSEVSAVGRTRTAPRPGAATEAWRFAFASCQNWLHGYYAPYRDMGSSDLDLVVHLGDYIYEASILPGAGVRDAHDLPVEVRVPAETLDGYRRRYALYKLDPDLQAAHQRFPWIVTWDDHEVSDDYAGDRAGDDGPTDVFIARRAAAYQAAYEHQPLRAAARPDGPKARMYRRYAFGDLLELTMLDTRQYRSPQHGTCSTAERARSRGYCAASLDPARTILGAEQKRWLLDGLAATRTRWSFVGNQVPFSRIDLGSATSSSYGGAGDKWDGYAAERDEILREITRAVREQGLNVVVITGDLHANRVFDIKADWDDPTSPTIGTEIVGTSISSDGQKRGTLHTTHFGGTPANPHELLSDDHNGYVRCGVGRDRLDVDLRVASTTWERDAAVTTLAVFGVAHGRPGARLVR